MARFLRKDGLSAKIKQETNAAWKVKESMSNLTYAFQQYIMKKYSCCSAGESYQQVYTVLISVQVAFQAFVFISTDYYSG